MNNFLKYSKYYDLLYGDKDYDQESEYIFKHLVFKTNQSLLELGCGSGGHAEYLSKKKINITGIDSSKTMVNIAKKIGFVLKIVVFINFIKYFQQY